MREAELQNCKILITGAEGFIGKNLCLRLGELREVEVLTFVRGDDKATLASLVAKVDAVIHLAGENRPLDEASFFIVNEGLTKDLVSAVRNEIRASGRKVPIIFSSSTQAELNNAYGRSKLAAENEIEALVTDTGGAAVIFRLPGVFGKWCKPNYNSVVATFCYNLSRGLPIEIHNTSAQLKLVYIDDVVTAFIAAVRICLEKTSLGFLMKSVVPEYSITLGELAEQIKRFDNSTGASLVTERVGVGFTRALYATYVSYFPTEQFSYQVPQHADARGVFVEMLKTPDCGQFSYFTAYPGVTRGGHYHHSKTEKFLVLKGKALFRFRHVLTNELKELYTNGDDPEVVHTIPGWSHDVTNVGDDEMVVMLWANENFDRDRSDTVPSEVHPL